MTLKITTSYHQTKAKSELRLKKARAVVLKQSFGLRRPPLARPRLTYKSQMKKSWLLILFVYLLCVLRKIFNVMDDD